MTNQQLELAYGALLGMGHAAALRAVYTLGYASGAGLPVDNNLDDKARAGTAPTVTQLQTITSSQKLKKPD